MTQEYALVPVGAIQPHPRNPRRGAPAAIDESIAQNGFYGAVVVQKSTALILAGRHRWERAQAAGIAAVPVIWADVDDATALRVIAVDNRTSDLAGYDEQALAELLESIRTESGGFEGTGFSSEDYDAIIADAGDAILREAKERVAKLSPVRASESNAGASSRDYVEQWLVLIRCRDEAEQLTLLERLTGEGLECSAMNR